jgi:hypothetical protein
LVAVAVADLHQRALVVAAALVEEMVAHLTEARERIPEALEAVLVHQDLQQELEEAVAALAVEVVAILQGQQEKLPKTSELVAAAAAGYSQELVVVDITMAEVLVVAPITTEVLVLKLAVAVAGVLMAALVDHKAEVVGHLWVLVAARPLI